MKRAVCIGGSLVALLTAAGLGPSTFVTLAAQAKATATTVAVDPLWPKPFPQKNAWILGSVTGVAVDGQDHVWVVHRGVDSLQTNEKGPALEPWASSCCFAAPQVLEFDAAGTLLSHWDPKTGTGYDWPHDPAGIAVDDKGNVWITGGLPASSLPAARGRGPAPAAAGAAPGAARGAAPAGRGAAPAAAAAPADAQVLKFDRVMEGGASLCRRTPGANMCSIPSSVSCSPASSSSSPPAAREALLQGPAALAPEPGREQLVGEVSPAAEAFGIHPGMRLGEALARCPRLALVPPDPVGVADAWERVLARLEAIGAAVEPGRPGLACFEARGLRRLHGGSLDGVLDATRERCAGRGVTARGSAPGRRASARSWPPPRGRARGARASSRAPTTWPPSRVALLRHRRRAAALPEALERLGITTLGELAALPRAALADRFGRAGLLAHDLAQRARHAAAPAPSRRASSRRRSSSRSPPRARSSSGRSACSSTACSPAASATGARCASSCSARRSSRAAPGASASSSASRWPTRRACAWSLAERLALLPAPAESAAAGGRALRPAASRRRGAVRRRRAPAARRACARRSARRARPPGPRPRCACWRSIPTRGSPSAAPC